MPTTKKAITVYLDRHLHERVARTAKADGRSVSNFIENALARAHASNERAGSRERGRIT